MINSCSATIPKPIALAGIGPTTENALQRLQTAEPSNVQFLHSDGSLGPGLLHEAGLLILVTELASVADCRAVQNLIKQMQPSGFATTTLCVAMKPSADVDKEQKVQAQHSLQLLEMHADATVVLSGDDEEDLGTWLTDRISGLAQAVANDGSVGIDIDELSSLLRNSDSAVWVNAQSEGMSRVEAAAAAIRSQYARHAGRGHVYHHAMVWVQGARQSLNLSETRSLMKTLSQHLLTDSPQLICGISYDESLGGRMRVSALLCRPQPKTN